MYNSDICMGMLLFVIGAVIVEGDYIRRFYFYITQLVHVFKRARLHEGITYAISRQCSNLCGISRCPIKSSGAFFSLMEQNFDNNTHGPLVQSAHQRVYP